MSDIRDLLRRDWDDTVSPELVERAARRTHRRARRHQALTAGTLALLLVVLTAGVTTALRTLERTEVRLVDDPDIPPPPNAPPGWRLFDASGLSPRRGHASVWTGSELVVWGGVTLIGDPDAPRAYPGGPPSTPAPEPPAPEWLADGAALDPAASRWRALAEGHGEGRSSASAVWTGSEMLVWGGGGDLTVMSSFGTAERPRAADGVAYDPATDTWRQVPQAPVAARLGPVAAWTGSELIVWGGGGDSAALGDGAAYDPDAGTWRLLAPSPLAPRAAAAAVWSGEELFVWGGYDAPDVVDGSGIYTDGAAYDPVTDTWRPVAPVPLPEWNGGEAVVAGGRFVIVANGIRSGDPQHVLAYDPDADSWDVMQPPHDAFVPGGWAIVSTGERAALLGVTTVPHDGGTESDALRATVLDPATGEWIGLWVPELLQDAWRTPRLWWTGTEVIGWTGLPGGAFAFDPGMADLMRPPPPLPVVPFPPPGEDVDALPEGALLFSADETTVSLRRDDGTVVDEFEMGGEATIVGLAARPGTEGERWAVAVSSSTGAHTDLEVRWRTPEGSIFFEDYWALAPPGPDGGFREEGVPLDAPVRVDATWSPDGDYLAWLDLDPEGEPALVVRTWADDGPGPAMAWKSFGDALPPGTRYEGLEGWQWLDQGVGGTREGRLLVAIRTPDGDRDVIGYRVRARPDPLDEFPLVFEGFEDITLGQRLGSRVLAMAPEGGASAYALVADGEWPILELDGDELLARIALPDGMPRGMPGDEPFLTARDRLLVVGLRSTTGPGGEA